MKLTLLTTLLLTSLTALHAAPPDLSKITSRADLDAVIAATADAPLKQALTDHAAAILAAAGQHPHVEAVIHTIESAPGTFVKINTTPEALKKAAGGDIALFDTLTLISTAILNGHAHDNRDVKADPYDAAFIEHLGHIQALETVRFVTAKRIEEPWLPLFLTLNSLKSLTIDNRGSVAPLGDTALAKLQPLTKLPGLKSLSLHYFSKATDAGLEQLAGLKNLESFSFRGNVPGHAFAKFEGWTNLKSIAFHGNAIDDEGLGSICERFPNLESLNLIHARVLTDASAVHLLKLRKLKNIIINGPKMTAAWHQNLNPLPLESLSVNQGNAIPAAAAIAAAKSIPTLRRLGIEAISFTDADLTALAGVHQIETLSIGGLALTEARMSMFQGFSHLKKLELVNYGATPDPATEAKIKALLPKVEVKFVH